MQPLTSTEIRACFVNCTKGEASRLPLPRDLDEIPWDHLDFLGWTDPGSPQAAYLVAIGDGGPVGIVLRLGSGRGASGRSNMCSICATFHSSSDVALMVAARAGASGRAGNTVGTYLCANLACSLYARGRLRPARVQPVETLSVEDKITRLHLHLDAFVRRVLS
ncbi:MAG: FBP domain-containing protein [Nocardioides sp.]|jgi:hypothetical protein